MRLIAVVVGRYVCAPYSCCSRSLRLCAVIAQVVEHVLGKNEVIGANPINGSLKHLSCKCSGEHFA